MVYRVSEILRDVRVALDENRESEALLSEGAVDTLELAEIIESKIEEAARAVVDESPVELLGRGKPLEGDVFRGVRGSGWMRLPDDFERLIYFKMSDWESGVRKAVGTETAEYERQKSRYGGVRGNSQKPVAAVVMKEAGLCLEFFGSESEEAEVESGLYYPEPRIDRHGGIDLPERLYRAVVNRIAEMVGGMVSGGGR